MDTNVFTDSFSRTASADEGTQAVFSRHQGQEWHWPLATTKAAYRDRTPLMRTVPYTLSVIPDEKTGGNLEDAGTECEGVALSMNLSNGGMLLVMNEAPEIQQVLKVCMPTPITGVDIPTLAEVRWSRQLSLGVPASLHLVGLKFLF